MIRFGGVRSSGALMRARNPSHSRSSTTAPMAAAFRSAWGPSDLSDRARRPAPSIARARQVLFPQAFLRVLAQMTLGDAGPYVLTSKSRNSARPGSQAPHAPPALTFGLPGKQRVNWGAQRRVLGRILGSLPGIG